MNLLVLHFCSTIVYMSLYVLHLSMSYVFVCSCFKYIYIDTHRLPTFRSWHDVFKGAEQLRQATAGGLEVVESTILADELIREKNI